MRLLPQRLLRWLSYPPGRPVYWFYIQPYWYRVKCLGLQLWRGVSCWFLVSINSSSSVYMNAAMHGPVRIFKFHHKPSTGIVTMYSLRANHIQTQSASEASDADVSVENLQPPRRTIASNYASRDSVSQCLTTKLTSAYIIVNPAGHWWPSIRHPNSAVSSLLLAVWSRL